MLILRNRGFGRCAICITFIGNSNAMQKPNKRLENQTCIVTGASSGIGEAVAKALGTEGANIVVNYHSGKEEAEEVADWIEKNSPDKSGLGQAIMDNLTVWEPKPTSILDTPIL